MVAMIDEKFADEFGKNFPSNREEVRISDGMIYLEVQAPYSKMILTGCKTIESRDYPLPKCLKGANIFIFETPKTESTLSSLGSFDELPAGLSLVGKCRFETSFVYDNWGRWNADRDKHCVPVESKFEANAESLVSQPKYGWIVQTYTLFESPMETPVLRRIHRSLFRVEKTVVLIRHAESVNNVDKRETLSALQNMGNLRALPTASQLSSAFSLMSIPMNTDLSANGEIMATNLRARLEKDNSFLLTFPQLIVHSHLLRAQKTCQILFSGKMDEAIMEKSSIFEKNISEHIFASMQTRVEEFKSWLYDREETFIVVVGHGVFFRDMVGTNVKMDNCEVKKCSLFSYKYESGDVRRIIGVKDEGTIYQGGL